MGDAVDVIEPVEGRSGPRTLPAGGNDLMPVVAGGAPLGAGGIQFAGGRSPPGGAVHCGRAFIGATPPPHCAPFWHSPPPHGPTEMVNWHPVAASVAPSKALWAATNQRWRLSAIARPLL